MKGYRTIVSNIVMALAAIAAIWGLDVPPEDLEKIASGIVAIIGLVNLVLRRATTTPLGKKE